MKTSFLISLPLLAVMAAWAYPQDYRQQIAPLISKLGCNAAACHGAAGGQGGFQLSLFGYDLKADHAAMTAGNPEPRANWFNPAESLLLRKPSGLEEHEGGKLFEPDGEEYKLLLAWIKARAPGAQVGKEWLEVSRLEVTPKRLLFGGAGDKPQRLSVVAYWNDGAQEDVTRFCRFESKAPDVVCVGREGLVEAVGPGATNLLIFYDRVISPIEAIVPLPKNMGSPARQSSHNKPIDQRIGQQLNELNLSPAPICTDEEFLRRVFLDLTGTLPTAREACKFSQSNVPDKRRKVVNTLLARNAYADYWAGWLCEVFGINEAVMPDRSFQQEEALQVFYWVRSRVQDNLGYDFLVEGLVTGLGRSPGEGFREYSAEMSRMIRQRDDKSFARRETVPYYWARTNIRDPSEKALAFSHAFLGVRLQCAECHKHPFDRWTQQDFKGLEAFFQGVKYGTPKSDQKAYNAMKALLVGEDSSKYNQRFVAAVRSGKPAPWKEVYLDQPPIVTPVEGEATPAELGGLGVLVNWLRDPEHPYIAAALVNRVWEHHLGAGIVDTPDDLSIGNPPRNHELLDYLVAGFVHNKYDMKWLHKEILNSSAYQRAARSDANGPLRRRQFSQASYRRLPAEVLLDAVMLSTASTDVQSSPAKLARGRMVGPQSVLRRSNRRRRALEVFGQPKGTAVCQRERSNDSSLRMALALYNGPELRRLIDRPDGWIAELAQAAKSNAPKELQGDRWQELVREAFWRCLSREPEVGELEECLRLCLESEDPVVGFRDVLWALVNTREFIFNH